jgi:hypothetical protein
MDPKANDTDHYYRKPYGQTHRVHPPLGNQDIDEYTHYRKSEIMFRNDGCLLCLHDTIRGKGPEDGVLEETKIGNNHQSSQDNTQCKVVLHQAITNSSQHQENNPI